jgi:3-methyl-2-oxobutanoate hydroxymethyltransferase
MTTQDRISVATLAGFKRSGKKFSVLTCYDAPTAGIMEAAGTEVLLVGDTAAEVVLGLPSTREIPPEFLLTLTAAVRRGARRAFVMADLPYACRRENDIAATVAWSRRFYEEAASDAVKIEVSTEDVNVVAAAVDAGIPVVAHLGLLPQSIESPEGYRAQGKDADSARRLIEDARRFEDAGACMLLLEAVASEVSREIAMHTDLPVIGCVSGPHCDGTVVVLHDMIGLGGGHQPRGVKQYEDLSKVLARAFTRYVDDIHAGRFPTERDVAHMKPGELDKLLALTGDT